jgi:hypothetical protein
MWIADHLDWKRKVRRRATPAALFLLAVTFSLWGQSASKPLVATGTLLCPGSEGLEKPGSGKAIRWALKTPDQKIFPLQTDRWLDTLCQEKRLRTREFELTLFKIPGSEEFEITRVVLLRDGKRISFHYYCPVCNITTATLIPCPCCQDEMEYREKELKLYP